jgi:hypothetical protein
MRVMAFAMDEGRLRIIEHNRRFYADRYSTPVYEHSMELVVQGDFLYHESLALRRFGQPESAYAAECRLAYEHVYLMHQQVSESWQKLQAFDWNVSYGMSPEAAAERMAR